MPKTTTKKSVKATPTKKSTKKSTKKVATTKKAPVKKKTATAKKAAAPKKKSAKAAPAKKDGLRKPQQRILAALLKAKKGLTRKQLAEKAPVDYACCTEYLGSTDDAVREANDENKFKSLKTLGLIKFVVEDVNDKDVLTYHITSAGKKVG